MYKHFFKRFFSFCISLIGLICISPLLLVLIVWLHFANKGAGVFFTHERAGKDAKMFKCIKFKTMTDERDSNGRMLPDEKRLTKVGRFIRALSLDELPQLFNVLKGDMALIGPRPLTPVYVELYNEEQARRMEVRPGITGWAQVHGRNHCKLSEKFAMDVWYVNHCTLWTDIKIIWFTIKNVLRHEDIGEGAGDMKQVDDLNFSPRALALSYKVDPITKKATFTWKDKQ